VQTARANVTALLGWSRGRSIYRVVSQAQSSLSGLDGKVIFFSNRKILAAACLSYDGPEQLRVWRMRPLTLLTPLASQSWFGAKNERLEPPNQRSIQSGSEFAFDS